MAKNNKSVRGVDVYKYENQQGRAVVGTSIYEAKAAARAVSSGMLQPRDKGAAKGMIDAATANHRAGIQENMGAQCHPTAKLPGPGDDSTGNAGKTWRNVKLVPSATVRTEFEGSRAYGLMGY